MSLKSFLNDAWNNATPWNTQDERNQNAKNAASAAQLQAEIADQAADNKYRQSIENNKTYVVIAIALVLLISVVAFFKFRH